MRPAPADETAAQRQALRRYRLYAGALLLAALLLFLASLFLLPPGFWTGLLKAASEAALVGGLADWFAVTALFRRPLGLPIPHTAVIPANKDRIGEGMGRFVERHFLDPALVAGKLRSLGLARRLAGALADEARSAALAERLSALLPYLMRTAGDAELRGFLGQALQRQLGRLDLPGLLSSTLELLYRADRHHALLDRLILAARDWLGRNEEQAYRLVEEKSRWWVPKRIDRRIAEALVKGVVELLGDLLQRDHELRHQFDAAVDRLIRELREDPRRRAQVQAFLAQSLAKPEVRAWVDELWTRLRQDLEQDAAAPDSLLRRTLAQGLTSLGRALAADEAMLTRLDQRIESTVAGLVVPWRAEIGRFIAEVVKSWDAGTVVERIELAVGRDLQYIRMNGTLVGALVGCAIYLLSHAAT